MKDLPTTLNARLDPDQCSDSDAPRPRGDPSCKALITQRLGQALQHMGVPQALAARILSSHALSIGGRTLSLHPLPEGMQAFPSTVALAAELDFLDGQRIESLRFALRMNTLTGLSQGSSITRTDDGMMVLLRPLDLLQFDDRALALALQSMAKLVIRLHQDFQREQQAQVDPRSWTLR